MSYNKLILSSFLLNTLLISTSIADERITFGAKVLFAGWQGNNGSVSSSFNSDEGGQLAFSASYSLNKFYTGLSLQSGKYNFSSSAPDQFTTTGRVSTTNTDVEHREVDLLAGYYFWKNVSLFADLKGVSNTWTSNNYKQDFGGLGFGVSGFLPISDTLTLFGSTGFVGKGDIKDSNKVKVGEGSSGALEFGAIYRLATQSTLNIGLKFRTYDFEYLDNTSQDYSVNGLFVGYNHGFAL